MLAGWQPFLVTTAIARRRGRGNPSGRSWFLAGPAGGVKAARYGVRLPHLRLTCPFLIEPIVKLPARADQR